MKRAVEAWLKTDPFNNLSAPLGPLRMADYAEPELEEAKQYDEIFSREYDAALWANHTSDAYVLLTVLFASVLFFSGIAGTLESRPLRITILVVALVLFVATMAFLGTMSICRQ